MKLIPYYEFEWKPCVKCGQPSHHVQLPDRFLCCACYVNEGNPPADWHPECMQTYQELQPDQKATHAVGGIWKSKGF